ncbi:MAG: T9SS type A sorting domain-containing protein [Aureispira sp.]|nr:T9SS type A sorting domain-containing protein [Aureispira sp.]
MFKSTPFIQVFLLACFVLIGYSSNAQCPATVYGQLSGNDTAMAVLPAGTTPAPVFTVTPSGLPVTEFVIVQKDSMADDLLGPAIIGTSVDGLITPNSLDLGTCNEFCILPFSYDSTQIKTLVDSLLAADYQVGTSCCTAVGFIAPGLCDTLNARGIYSGADVNSIAVLFDILDILNGGTASTSIQGLVLSLDQLNQSLSLFGNCGGGLTQICFAVDTFATSADYYIIPHRSNSALNIDVLQDTVTINEFATSNLTASVYPATAIDDTLDWWLEGATAGASIDPVTGVLTAGTAGTFLVIGHMTNACIEDTAVVIVEAPTGVAKVNSNPNRLSIQTQPNPFQKQLQVVINADIEGEHLLRLTNITGQILIEQQQLITKGTTTINLKTEYLPAGLYWLQLSNNKTNLTQKVVKQ